MKPGELGSLLIEDIDQSIKDLYMDRIDSNGVEYFRKAKIERFKQEYPKFAAEFFKSQELKDSKELPQ